MSDNGARRTTEGAEGPITIWAPNGWTFELIYILDENAEISFNPHDRSFLRYELRGPNGDEAVLIFDHHFELISNSLDNDMSRSIAVTAKIALESFLEWSGESPFF